MKTWLRLTLVVVSVGGSFAGVIGVANLLFSLGGHQPLYVAMVAFSNHDTQSNHDWVGELFLFGASQSCLSSCRTTCSQEVAPVAVCQAPAAMARNQAISAGAAMHQVLGLVQLTVRTSCFPWAKP